VTLSPLALGASIAVVVVLTVGVLGFGIFLGRRERGGRLRSLEQAAQQFERKAVDALRANEDLWERMERSETAVRELQNSIVQIPEIAQRLYRLRELREIPDKTLDLVQEIFQPAYSVFYRLSNGKLVAVACRGESEFRIAATGSTSARAWWAGRRRSRCRSRPRTPSSRVPRCARATSDAACRARASRCACRSWARSGRSAWC
jgi:hypothetical protein